MRTVNSVVIDEKFLEDTLKRLLEGVDCQEKSHRESQLIRTQNVSFYARNGQVFDVSQHREGVIIFRGDVMYGGIYDAKNDYYVSDGRDYIYKLQGNDLQVQSICTKDSFLLKNFQLNANPFSIRLSKNPNREVGVVVCVTQSMDEYIFALKEIAPFFAKHLFKSEDAYTKATLVSFASLDSNDWGTFYEADAFVKAINALKLVDSNTRMLYLSVIKAMSHFTKDNGLKKEIYLITNAKESDPQNAARMLPLTKNLNRNIVAKSRGCLDNCVAIHCFSVGVSLQFLRDLATETAGNFYYSNNSYGFKKSLLTQSSGGDFDINEIGTEIRPSKNHKIYDPNNPHC